MVNKMYGRHSTAQISTSKMGISLRLAPNRYSTEHHPPEHDLSSSRAHLSLLGFAPKETLCSFGSTINPDQPASPALF